MIKTLNAIRLAKAKFHTKRRLTILSLITSGLLFGVLIATIVIANGVVTSLDRFIKEVGGKRYQVAINANIPFNKITDKFNNPSHRTIDEVRSFETQYRAAKSKQYQAQGLKYDPGEDAPSLKFDEFSNKSEPTKYQVTIDHSSSITKQLFSREYERWAKSATNKTANLIATAKKYGSTGYYPSPNSDLFYKFIDTKLVVDGKEELKDWVDNKLIYDDNPISSAHYTGAAGKLTDKYITYHGRLEGVPVVIPAAHLAKKFAGRLGVSPQPPADDQARVDWLKQIKTKASGFTYQICHRNKVEQDILTKIQQARNELAGTDSKDSNSSNANKSKTAWVPTDGAGLYYRLPTTPCGDITIIADKRTAEQKAEQVKQNLLKQRQGEPILPYHQLITMQVVGVSNESNTQDDNGKDLIGIGKSILAARPFFNNMALIPVNLYSRLPTKQKLDNIIGEKPDILDTLDLPDRLAKQFPYGLLEFATAQQAHRFMTEQTTTEQRASDSSKPYVAEQYGVNFLVLDELARQLRQTITIVAAVIAGLAIIIIWTTISRIISESRQETAVYRAIGAKRRDITLIYLVYALMLAILTIIIAGIIGMGISVAIDQVFAPKLTAIARSSVSIIGGSSQIKLFVIDESTLAQLALVNLSIIVVALIASIQPIISNTHRSPASDLRAE